MDELEIISHRRMDGLTVFLNTLDYRTPHSHGEWELLLVLEEPLLVRSGGSTRTAEEGDMALLDPLKVHELKAKEKPSTFLCVQVSPQILALRKKLTLDEVVMPKELSRRIRAQMVELASSYLGNSEFSGVYCRGLVCLIFNEIFSYGLCREVSPEEIQRLEAKNHRLSALMDYVDRTYREKPLLSEFAKKEGLSLSYLSHFVKETLNQSFQSYVEGVRVNAALKAMADGDKKLTVVAEEAGFSDYKYFTQAFRRHYGVTAEEYRRSMVKPEGEWLRHSLHSLERLHSDEESLRILESKFVI